MQTSTRGYAQMVTIATDPATAWRACTDPDWLRRWYAIDAVVEQRRGGRWRMRRRDGAACEAIIDVCDVGRRLRLIYLTPPTGGVLVDGSPLVDDLLFDVRGSEALVRVLGSGVPVSADWDRHYVMLRQAWAYYLRELKRALEDGVAEPGA